MKTKRPKIEIVKDLSSLKTVERQPASIRNDGWKNLVTLLGTNADKRTASRLSWEYRDPEFFEQMYSGGGIPARIVDLVPDESCRRWIDWQDIETEEELAIEERCEQLDLRGTFLRSWKWARAFGGACLHIVTDTSDPASPLQDGENVLALRDLSRWDVRVLTTDVEYDFGSPNFGHPRLYYLNVQMGSQYKGYPIHWTRMIRFDGQLVPRRTFIRNNYWHDSILNRLYDTIRDYQMSNDAAAACLQDFNVDVFKMKNLANLVQAGKESVVHKRIQVMQFAKSVLNSMMLDADQEDYENKGRSLEGVAELLKHQANRLVAETDIPHTKLLGESPDGSNATGNSTSQQWDNFIQSEQDNYAKAKLRRLIDIVFPELKPQFKFRSLRVLDESEEADLHLKQAQADQIYLQNAVVDPAEIAASRFGGKDYSIETELDQEARDAGLAGSTAESELDPMGMPQDPMATSPDQSQGSAALTGETPPSLNGSGDDVQDTALNGAQVTSLVDIVKSVAAGELPRDSAVQIISHAFQIDDKEADKILGAAGQGFKITPAEAVEDPDKPEPPKGGKKPPAEKADGVEGSESLALAFQPRDEELVMPAGKPVEAKSKPIISQMMSEPMRDPSTDPHMKGPGVPNKPRTFMPTTGNGVTAQSGVKAGEPVTDIPLRPEGQHVDNFAEHDHPRAGDGKFGSGGGGAVHSEKYKGHDIHVHEGMNGNHSAQINGKPMDGNFLGKSTAVQRARTLIDRGRSDSGEPSRASKIIVRDGDKFLMGKRRDNGRWTFPGGGVDGKESHHQAGIRELDEETGLKADKLKFLGARMVEPKQGETVHVNLYQHHKDEDAKPSFKKDPDKEFDEFRWLSTKEKLPEEIAGNLHHPNDIALQHLGLLK